MPRRTYSIVNETTEDRFDETESLEEPIRIAQACVKKSKAGDPISIEQNGRVLRQFVLSADGIFEEPSVG